MKQLSGLGAALAVGMLVSGCASIITGGHDDIMVKTDPEGADCTVYRGADVLGHINPTPGGIVVRRSYDDILVRCVKDGYGDSEAMNTSGVNGWLFGNIALGGLIGIIIDTATANATSYDSVTFVALAVKSEPGASPEKPAEVPVATAQSAEPAEVPSAWAQSVEPAVVPVAATQSAEPAEIPSAWAQAGGSAEISSVSAQSVEPASAATTVPEVVAIEAFPAAEDTSLDLDQSL